MSTHKYGTSSSQSGFALILALLALLLLTVLGLTLATSTSTELQIAANYRYSRQALYNAEAGLQTARYLLGQLVGSAGYPAELDATLPPARTSPTPTWALGSAPGVVAVNPDDYYPQMPILTAPGCDPRGGVGYGRVLVDIAGTIYRDVAAWNSEPLQGTFTIWVRRPLISNSDGTFKDESDSTKVVVTVRGTAPFAAGGLTGSQHFAARIIEQTLDLTRLGSKPCLGSGIYQTGRDQLGTGFDPCGNLGGPDFAPGW